MSRFMIISSLISRTGDSADGEKLPSTRLCPSIWKSAAVRLNWHMNSYYQKDISSLRHTAVFVAQIDELYQLKKREKKPEPKREKKRIYRYDFTPNGVDLNSFPYNVWRKLSKDILLDDRTELFRSGDPQGEYGFRGAICNYLYQARGVDCSPEQIVIGAGSDYILILLSMILGKEHTIAFEDPTYKQAYRVIQTLGYETVPVTMDHNGMRISELEDSEADIAYVTPSHQYPTGIVMPIKRRMELLKWAYGKEGRYIIEDDYDSEFRYKGKPIPALQGYDAEDKVIYLGTFSKSIAPAIRLSYMVLPKSLLDVYRTNVNFINSTVSKVDQMIVQHFIEDGYYERHLNKTRALYKNRHDVLIDALKPLADICAISGEHAGVHILLTFEKRWNENELIERAKKEDIRVYGLRITGSGKIQMSGQRFFWDMQI